MVNQFATAGTTINPAMVLHPLMGVEVHLEMKGYTNARGLKMGNIAGKSTGNVNINHNALFAKK